jgi:hypothetical protein
MNVTRAQSRCAMCPTISRSPFTREWPVGRNRGTTAWRERLGRPDHPLHPDGKASAPAEVRASAMPPGRAGAGRAPRSKAKSSGSEPRAPQGRKRRPGKQAPAAWAPNRRAARLEPSRRAVRLDRRSAAPPREPPSRPKGSDRVRPPKRGSVAGARRRSGLPERSCHPAPHHRDQAGKAPHHLDRGLPRTKRWRVSRRWNDRTPSCETATRLSAARQRRPMRGSLPLKPSWPVSSGNPNRRRCARPAAAASDGASAIPEMRCPPAWRCWNPSH